MTSDDLNADGSDGAAMHILGMAPEEHIKRVYYSNAAHGREYLRDRGIIGRLRDFFHIEHAFPPGRYDRIWNETREFYDRVGIDVIWCTAPDFDSIRLGRDLARRLAIPWIADFRDISEQEGGGKVSMRERILYLRTLWRRKCLVKSAARLTSVSKYHCAALERVHHIPCVLIYNGYDEDMFRKACFGKHDTFRIVYTGRILDQRVRNPEILFEALDILLAGGHVSAELTEVVFKIGRAHV